MEEKVILYKVNSEVEVRDFEEQKLIFNPVRDTVHVLNQTSADILEMLLQPNSIEKIVDEMILKYGQIAEIKDDVCEIVRDYVESGIVVELTDYPETLKSDTMSIAN